MNTKIVNPRKEAMFAAGGQDFAGDGRAASLHACGPAAGRVGILASRLAACAVLATLAACGGGSGETASTAATPLPALATAVPTTSDSCTDGAMTIRIGLDANANGVLDESEVSYTQLVCTGDGEAAWQVSFVAEPAGANCAAGGQRALFGPDTDGDGVVQASESRTSGYVCNGAAGATGPAGSNGTDGTNGVTWTTVASDTDAAADTGYLVGGVSETTLTLPDNPAVGSIVAVNGLGTGGWRIAQRAGQSVQTGALPLAARWAGPWTVRTLGPPNWGAIASSSDGRRLVAANGGDAIYTSIDWGATWTARTNIGFPVNAASSADGRVLAVGLVNASAQVSRDGGTTWSSPLPSGIWWVAMSADGTFMTATRRGDRIYRSEDGGVTWTPGPVGNWNAVAMAADGRTQLASQDNGQLHLSMDYGQNWTALIGSGTRLWESVAVSGDASRMLAVASNDFIYLSSDFGLTWQPKGASALRFTATASLDGRVLVTAVYGGRVEVSEDFGTTWQFRESVNRQWAGLACSSDGGRIVGAAPGNAAVNGGLLFSPRSTVAGAGHGLAGEPDAAVQLQYLGGGVWKILNSAGAVQAW